MMNITVKLPLYYDPVKGLQELHLNVTQDVYKKLLDEGFQTRATGEGIVIEWDYNFYNADDDRVYRKGYEQQKKLEQILDISI